MTARRMLVGAGAGPLSAPPALAGFALTASPAGGWTWFNDPRALSYGGHTYFGYINGSGDVCVRAVNESTLSVAAESVLHAALEVDDHDNPALFVRPSDHRLIAFYSAHVAPLQRKRVSTNSLDSDPTLSGGFASEVTTTYGELVANQHFTYCNPVRTTTADGVSSELVWMFYRCHEGGTTATWHYSVSTDGAATWPGSTAPLHDLTYSRVISDELGRIDVVCAEHPNGGDGTPTKVYHLYRESARWHQSDGTLMSTTLPYVKADMSVVYDAGSDPTWIWDIAYDGSGHPVVLFSVYPSTTGHRYWYGRWTGSAWDTHEIVAAGTYLPTAVVGGNPIEAYYSGGLALDHSDTNVVYASVGLGSNLWEVRRYVTPDGGTRWSYTVVSRAGGKNARPIGVRDHGTAIQALYWRGTYASYVDYALGTDRVGG